MPPGPLPLGWASVHVLVVGSGAREHALLLALRRDPEVDGLSVAPGNAGTASIADQYDLDVTSGDAVVALAKQAFTHANCYGLARADFFVDGDDILVNELNTMPGFTATSVYGKLWIASGLAYADLVEDLCRLAMARAQAAKAYKF